jgi:hypothetical protein
MLAAHCNAPAAKDDGAVMLLRAPSRRNSMENMTTQNDNKPPEGS